MADVSAIVAGKWHVIYSHNPQGMQVISFEFEDKPPINIALTPEHAEQIGKALLENIAHPPPRKNN